MWVPFATRSSRAHSYFWKDHEARRVRNRLLMGAPLLLLPCLPARAQTTTTEFFPEFDTYFKLKSHVQIVFQAKETKEGGDPTQVEFGPSVELYLKPLLKLQDITVSRPGQFEVQAIGLVGRISVCAFAGQIDGKPLGASCYFSLPNQRSDLITDRNRSDLDWSAGNFTWRYRNRLTVERRVAIRSFHPAPYISAEAFYESQYNKWSTTKRFIRAAYCR